MPSSFANALFWAAVVCCAVAQLCILRSTVVGRGAAPDADAPSAGRRAAELAWVVLPAVVLAAVLAMTWRALHPTLS